MAYREQDASVRESGCQISDRQRRSSAAGRMTVAMQGSRSGAQVSKPSRRSSVLDAAARARRDVGAAQKTDKADALGIAHIMRTG